MSRYNGSRVDGYPPPHVPKTKSGVPRQRMNRYADAKPSEQRNSAGQKREQRRRNPLAAAANDAINQLAYRTKRA